MPARTARPRASRSRRAIAAVARPIPFLGENGRIPVDRAGARIDDPANLRLHTCLEQAHRRVDVCVVADPHGFLIDRGTLAARQRGTRRRLLRRRGGIPPGRTDHPARTRSRAPHRRGSPRPLLLRLSTTRTRCPSSTSRSVRCEPMKPAPPVTRYWDSRTAGMGFPLGQGRCPGGAHARDARPLQRCVFARLTPPGTDDRVLGSRVTRVRAAHTLRGITAASRPAAP